MYQTKHVVVLQKGNDRYTFATESDDSGKERYRIDHEHLLTGGASRTCAYVQKDAGNNQYKKLMSKGFKKFRNINEVSWWATTPCYAFNPKDEEIWKVEGSYLVPVKLPE